MKVIIGLGNPGSQYEGTRHNLGFMTVMRLAKDAGVRFEASRRCKGFETEIDVDGQSVRVLMPATFMNLSGRAVKPFVRSYDADLKDVLVVVDDYTLDFGQLRLRRRGSDGGHNGLASIIEMLEDDGFPRLKMGIGVPPGKKDPADFVLEKFTKQEQEELDTFINEAAECCRGWISGDIDEVMSQYNKRKANGKV